MSSGRNKLLPPCGVPDAKEAEAAGPDALVLEVVLLPNTAADTAAFPFPELLLVPFPELLLLLLLDQETDATAAGPETVVLEASLVN